MKQRKIIENSLNYEESLVRASAMKFQADGMALTSFQSYLFSLPLDKFSLKIIPNFAHSSFGKIIFPYHFFDNSFDEIVKD